MKINFFYLSALIILLFTFSTQGQLLMSGDLDPTFGQNGKTIIPTFGNFQLSDMALQSDGKIVVTGLGGKVGSLRGYFTIIRYNADGTLDTGFGTGGINFYTFPFLSEARRIAVQTDGKIIVAGDSGIDFSIIRVNSNGELDTSFGDNGLCKIDFSDALNTESRLTRPLDSPTDLLIQSDNKILIGGYSVVDPDLYYSVARINSDGSLDADFGHHGKFSGKYNTLGRSAINAAALQSDGSIVAVGFTNISSEDSNIRSLMIRITPNGILDETFAESGGKIEFIKNASVSKDLAIQPDGKILVTGEDGFRTVNPTDEGFLMRYDEKGRLDTSFGIEGKTFLNFSTIPNGVTFVSSVKLQSDGKILILGSFTHPTQVKRGFGIARYLADGTLDPSFGNNGIVITTFDLGESSDGKALMIQADGKILASGVLNIGITRQAAITRYLWRRQRARGKF